MKMLRLTALALAALLVGCGQSPVAPTGERADTALAAKSKGQTSLQRHVAYFDANGDGLIAYNETVRGVEALGVGAVPGRVLATGLHAVLGPKTSGKMTTQIRIANIHLGVHPGSINFDAQGNFMPESFKAMFATYDTNGSGALSKSEVFAMLKARKKNAVSYNLSKTAFTVLLAVASDTQDGKEQALSRARMQSFYDGSLFYTIAKERSRKAGASDVDLEGVDLSAPPEAIEDAQRR